MDAFIQVGSGQACKILGWAQWHLYDETCTGYDNVEAFYQAGIYFWVAAGITLLVFLALLQRTLRFTFG